MVRGSGIICWLILHFRDDSVFLFRDRGNRFFGCRGGGRGELNLGGKELRLIAGRTQEVTRNLGR